MMEGVNLRYIVSTFLNVTMYPQYNNMLIKIKKPLSRILKWSKWSFKKIALVLTCRKD
jgi:hypothetical protein